jgi:phage terminase large subunit-like protein
MALSMREYLTALPEAEKHNLIESLSEEQRIDMMNLPWWFTGRPEQQEPEGSWIVWLILAGRGWGKTRTGAEWLCDQVLNNPKAPDGAPTEWAIIGETFSDTRVMCVEGPSGVLRVLERKGLVSTVDFAYNKASWQITFRDGQKIHMFGADNPDAGRGFNLSGVWADEISKWRYSYESWSEGIAPALRIGQRPRAVITTTPKPIKILRDWVARNDSSIYVTRGSTFDNATNLSQAALIELQARYAGTRTGRQELYGELLEDTEGALWQRKMIDDTRVKEAPTLIRIVVAIDPAVTSGESSDFTGIIVAGLSADGQFYVLADRTVKESPDTWARIAVEAYHEWKADRVVAEVNNGGDMVQILLRTIDPSIPYRKVVATRGKRVRAEPISALYEQKRVHHVGAFDELEDQMVTWTPDMAKSPDRIDALVWALTELNEGSNAMISLSAMANFCPSCRFPASKSVSICPRCGTLMQTELAKEDTHGSS